MTNVNEIWVSTYGYEEIYEISNLGNIRKKTTKRELIGEISKHGYRRVCLTKNKKITKKTIHRLVLQSFLGHKEDLVVNHKNGIKTDNRLENLEWCTISENTKHSFDNGFQKQKRSFDNPNAKLWVHKEYGLFLTTVELYKLYGTNGVNKKPMEQIKLKYDRI